MAPGAGPAGSRPGRVEWILAALAALLALVICATPVTVSVSFIEMFREFGSIDELPFVTRAALSRWYGVGFAALVVVVAAAALVLPFGVAARRLTLTASCGLGLAGLAVYIFGVYLPLFELADLVGP